jgi:hypothetical protein
MILKNKLKINNNETVESKTNNCSGTAKPPRLNEVK